jgi:hypothetical protein
MEREGWGPGSLPVEHSIEPILGYRAWRLLRTEAGPRIAPTTPRSIWEPGTAPAATCSGSHTRLYMVLDPTATPHKSPDRGCTCGWHAAREPSVLVRPGGPAAVVGQVSLWGKVIEHTHGYRAEFAYPARLRLTCPACVRNGRWPAIPDVVLAGGDDLVPSCAEHEERARGVSERLEPLAVQSAMLDDYGVELLPVEALPDPNRVDLITRLRRRFER